MEEISTEENGWQEKTIFRFYEGRKFHRREEHPELSDTPIIYKIKSTFLCEDYEDETTYTHLIKIKSHNKNCKYVNFDDIIDNVYQKDMRKFFISIFTNFEQIFERDILINLFEPVKKIHMKCKCCFDNRCSGFTIYCFLI